MKISRTTMVIAAQAVAIVLLAWALVYYARDEWKIGQDDETEGVPAASRISQAQGVTVVNVAPAAQAAGGITTALLAPVDVRATVRGYALVVSLAPLIDLSSRFAVAQSQAAAARASLADTGAEFRRVKGLYEDRRNVSARELAAAEAAWRRDQALAEGAQRAAEAALAAMREQWGPVLAGWASAPGSPELGPLASGKEVLVQVTLPDDGAQESPAPAVVDLSPLGEGASFEAHFVSPSPRADPALQGRTLWYRASARHLRIGERLAALGQGRGPVQPMAAVPDSAVLWYGGKAWIYVVRGKDAFSRREVRLGGESGDQWVGDASLAGARAVVHGAALLLSEELKSQLKADD